MMWPYIIITRDIRHCPINGVVFGKHHITYMEVSE